MWSLELLTEIRLFTATVLARLLYAAPAWRGFATAQDCSRIDRFINRTVNLGQRFSTGGTRTTGGTPNVAKWYSTK